MARPAGSSATMRAVRMPRRRTARASTASADRRRDASRAAFGGARTSRFDHHGHALLLDRRRDVAGDRPDRGGRGRHRRPVAHLCEHLEVVPLVADRERLAERHARPPREPADGPALGDARRDELEEARVADRHVGAPAKWAAARGAISVGRGGSPTARTFVTGWPIEPARSGTSSARAPMNAE